MNENFENLIYDIQRSDIPHIKAGLINYLKFATARSPMSLRIEAEITGPQKEEVEILNDTVSFCPFQILFNYLLNRSQVKEKIQQKLMILFIH